MGAIHNGRFLKSLHCKRRDTEYDLGGCEPEEGGGGGGEDGGGGGGEDGMIEESSMKIKI